MAEEIIKLDEENLKLVTTATIKKTDLELSLTKLQEEKSKIIEASTKEINKAIEQLETLLSNF